MVLLSKFRQDIPPKDWKKQDLSWIMENLGGALTADDIDQIPDDVLTER